MRKDQRKRETERYESKLLLTKEQQEEISKARKELEGTAGNTQNQQAGQERIENMIRTMMTEQQREELEEA